MESRGGCSCVAVTGRQHLSNCDDGELPWWLLRCDGKIEEDSLLPMELFKRRSPDAQACRKGEGLAVTDIVLKGSKATIHAKKAQTSGEIQHANWASCHQEQKST